MVVKRIVGRAEWRRGGPEVQRLLQEGWAVFRQTRAWEPPTDVYENEDGLVVQMEIAGMREEEFSITLGERLLVIEGVRRDPEPKRAYYQMEIRYGEFRAEVYLPWAVDPERVEATYEGGFLRLLIPRPPARRVQVVGPAGDCG
ncbi:MAG TPA: Hsp20/alpha crystallin family protein [Anaerolineales bacterium]|nr:Hsp20/alpha crystallin family protein [Anaerolineae bacterium]HIQ02074.1 Hsp20/alpha crystallin family protein [Anaerolineales bacterium]